MPVLTIAGADPTGGAGVQADLQTFSSLGCHGLAVVTSVTIQDTLSVRDVHHLPVAWVREQLACLLSDVRVGAIKTGMLGEAGIVRAVAEGLAEQADVPIVVDPVIRATSGLPLLDELGVEELRRVLLPRAALVTPNLQEAEWLTGMPATGLEEMRRCARALVELGAQAALVKGGHLEGEPVDVLCVEGELVEFRSRRVGGRSVHGTGCALSAAIAAFVARGHGLREAVRQAKAYVEAGVRQARAIGRGALVLDYRAAAGAVEP